MWLQQHCGWWIVIKSLMLPSIGILRYTSDQVGQVVPVILGVAVVVVWVSIAALLPHKTDYGLQRFVLHAFSGIFCLKKPKGWNVANHFGFTNVWGGRAATTATTLPLLLLLLWNLSAVQSRYQPYISFKYRVCMQWSSYMYMYMYGESSKGVCAVLVPCLMFC